jgi:hypothetical protein
MNIRRFWRPVIISLVITPLCLFVAAISGGVGHGDYTLAIILFPYAALLAAALDPLFNSTPLMIVIAVIQYPFYGVALGLSLEKNQLRLCAVGLVVLHVVVTAAAYFGLRR